MTNEELVRQSLENLGGKQMSSLPPTCMTRLRIEVQGCKQDQRGSHQEDRGRPRGGARQARLCGDRGGPRQMPQVRRQSAAAWASPLRPSADTQKRLAGQQGGCQGGPEAEQGSRAMLKTFGDFFVPLLPGVIAAGLCSGLATLMTQVMPNYAKAPSGRIVYNLLALIKHRIPELPDGMGWLPGRREVRCYPHPGRYAGHDHRPWQHRHDLPDPGSVR